MSKLEEREKRRKQSIVGSMIDNECKSEPKKSEKDSDRVQKAYYLDKDLFKALKLKSIQEEINLTEAVNDALRKGLTSYL